MCEQCALVVCAFCGNDATVLFAMKNGDSIETTPFCSDHAVQLMERMEMQKRTAPLN